MNESTVTISQEEVLLPTYRTAPPDKNPMFFEKRVYQGSSGVVYPNPVIEKIEDVKVDMPYQAIFIENDYLRIMILPQLGGRVHMAFDKIAQRHFIYYNEVIKPALVGLCGPWISGGIEFNWPQHHRPSTFEPVDFSIEEHADGSKTVWVNEVEKMFHTKGMASFTLYPDKAYLEIKAQVYNRTTLPQTFLWWANPAVGVNDHYQSVFPPDVNAVFDHGKRDVSTFPIATGTYYKVDYSPGTDISRYKNIPVPTSYMAVNSDFNFVGGYEHDTRAGVLHVADHHVSPGKKQWTWGNGDFGLAWDRNLTDVNGPYIELMTGVFTDNQPDFSWLMPCEEKSFTQYFMPYRELGMVKNASKDFLIGIEKKDNRVVLQVFATAPQTDIRVVCSVAGVSLSEETVDISPRDIYYRQLTPNKAFSEKDLAVFIYDWQGKELLRYDASALTDKTIPEAAKPAESPEAITTNEDLFLTGQHLEQYRHATYSPVPYYQEAIRRDPTDIRSNNAMGVWLLRRGQFAASEPYFRSAIASATRRNPNPYDSEPYYNLGLCLRYQDKKQEAYDAFFKATWSGAWQDSGYFAVAQLDLLNGDYELALEHINWSIDRNARNGKAYLIKIHALRKLNRLQEAIETALIALKKDGFNQTARYELIKCYQYLANHDMVEATLKQFLKLSRGNSHNLIEYALEYATIGLYNTASEILRYATLPETTRDPMLNYYLSFFSYKTQDTQLSEHYFKQAEASRTYISFPNRLDDIGLLQWVMERYPTASFAPYLLGNLWYDKRQYPDAVTCWKSAVAAEPGMATAWRNLAIAAFNKDNDPKIALQLFEKAFSLNIADSRVLMELDQLYKRLNFDPGARLDVLVKHLSIVRQRDDLYLEMIAIHNFLGNYDKAYQLIIDRKFHPWEGGEGKVSGQYVYCLTELAKSDMLKRDYAAAISKLIKAQSYPHNLGEGKLPGARENDLFYWLGCAYQEIGNDQDALRYWQLATVGLSEPSAAIFYNDQQPDKIFYQGLAWQKLGEKAKALQIFDGLIRYGEDHLNDPMLIDYFAVSLPDLLIFEDDLNERNYIHCQYISGLGYLGVGDLEKAKGLLRSVLDLDAMHFGAKTHLSLLELIEAGNHVLN